MIAQSRRNHKVSHELQSQNIGIWEFPLQEPTSLEAEYQEYTKESFLEAILKFIVGDDQVCFILSNLNKL